MSPTFEALLEAFSSFGGIGRKMAQRMAVQILEWDEQKVVRLAQLLEDVKKKVKPCRLCFALSEEEICSICQQPGREESLCVVETTLDVMALEKAAVFKGKYHVLGGVYSPSDGVGAEDLHIHELRQRVKDKKISEVVLATNPTPQGETTAHFVMEYIKDLPVKITRIGRGMPEGSFIDYADAETLRWALKNRTPLRNSKC